MLIQKIQTLENYLQLLSGNIDTLFKCMGKSRVLSGRETEKSERERNLPTVPWGRQGRPTLSFIAGVIHPPAAGWRRGWGRRWRGWPAIQAPLKLGVLV